MINILLLTFIGGIIAFVFQYRKRKLSYEEEKLALEKMHVVELLNSKLDIRQQTMQFIGREIHDSVSQKLILASIYSQRIEFDNEFPALTEKLKTISKILNSSLDELRELSKNLNDLKFEQLSLHDLLLEECNRVNESTLCKVTLKCGDKKIIDNSTKVFLLRIVQEFIQNSIKHASCRNIVVEVSMIKESLHLDLKDDGIGFELADVKSEGMGLANMRRRIQHLGAEAVFESVKHEGTHLNLILKPEQLNHFSK